MVALSMAESSTSRLNTEHQTQPPQPSQEDSHTSHYSDDEDIEPGTKRRRTKEDKAIERAPGASQTESKAGRPLSQQTHSCKQNPANQKAKRKWTHTLQALCDFLYHIGDHCIPNKKKGTSYYQKIVRTYCELHLGDYFTTCGSEHWNLLQSHKIYWLKMQRDSPKGCRLAEWCQLCINNRQKRQTWKEWCVSLVACLLDSDSNLLPIEERNDLDFEDETACGVWHENMLENALHKYMGDAALATHIFEKGLPTIFELKGNLKGDEVFKAKETTMRCLLVEALHWWIEFIHDCTLFEHDAFSEQPKQRAYKRLRTMRSCPKSTTVRVATRYDDGKRSGQLGQWMWVEHEQQIRVTEQAIR